jgi:hypothetical protein
LSAPVDNGRASGPDPGRLAYQVED